MTFICAACRKWMWEGRPPVRDCRECAMLGAIIERYSSYDQGNPPPPNAIAGLVVEAAAAFVPPEPKPELAPKPAKELRWLRSYPLTQWGFDRETYPVFDDFTLERSFRERAMERITLEAWEVDMGLNPYEELSMSFSP